jgi:predicted transcriptional regulator
MVEEDTLTLESNHIELTAAIIAAFVERNAISRDDLPKLIADVHASLRGLKSGQSDQGEQERTPAVRIGRSVTPDHLVCLECGERFRSLKRHLRTAHGLTAELYREEWGLPGDYPMVAPKYSEARSRLAKDAGLGKVDRSGIPRPARSLAPRAG